MRKAIQRLKNERGLTLVELLAVIVILGIIAIIAFVFIGGIIENTKKDAHIANAQQIISAGKLHEATGGTLPVSITDLKSGNYLAEILDPWAKVDYTDGTATVSKDANGVYSINGFNPNTTTNCKEITATQVDLVEDGRALCE